MSFAVLARRAAAPRSAVKGYFLRSPSRSTATAVGKAKAAKPWSDYVPVYGALGATAFSVTLGLGTAAHELAHAPNVRLDKKKRETVPEVAAPDLTLDEADRFRGRSLFRKVARVVMDDDRDLAAGPVAMKKAVTLKEAGVDPPGIEQSREEVLRDLGKRSGK